MMKRGTTLVSIISSTIKALSFKFSPEIVKMLTQSLFTDEYIINEESASDIRDYFAALASKLDSKEASLSLVGNFLLRRYQDAKSSSAVNTI